MVIYSSPSPFPSPLLLLLLLLFNLNTYIYSDLSFFLSLYLNQQSTINIIFDRKVGLDPVSKGMYIMLKYFNIGQSIDVAFWSQNISFILVGIIIATSIRGFLNYLMKVRLLIYIYIFICVYWFTISYLDSFHIFLIYYSFSISFCLSIYHS